MRLLYFFILLFSLFSCSETVKEKASANNTKILNKRPVREQEQASANGELDPQVKFHILKLDSMFDKTPYYTKVNNEFIFYVCKGKWNTPSNGKFNNEDILLGIVNQNYDTLLPVQYTKIYNPDVTVKDYIEIEKNGKRGLFNYKTQSLVDPQYDAIFPSHKSEYLAFGKAGNEYYAITSESIQKYDDDIPTYIDLGQKWSFDVKSKAIHYLNDSYIMHYEGDPEEGKGVVFTPSYLNQLGFLPELVQSIGTEGDYFGISATEGKIIKSVSISDNISALISSFYEEGVDGRGWQITQNNVITVDAKNNVVNNKLILESPDRGMLYFCGENMNGFRFIDNNLLEVYEIINSDKVYSAYDHMTYYSYYQIRENGEINKLESNRLFDFTKFTLLNENHFKGCFSKHLNDITKIGEEEGNLWVNDHLTLEDLDLMRNEIYAEYGLKFKTGKWQQYFSKQSWYTPVHENVDHLLSEIDKKNVEFIISIKEKMRGKEKEVTGKRLIVYAPAG